MTQAPLATVRVAQSFVAPAAPEALKVVAAVASQVRISALSPRPVARPRSLSPPPG